jgi:hypothetical protein
MNIIVTDILTPMEEAYKQHLRRLASNCFLKLLLEVAAK